MVANQADTALLVMDVQASAISMLKEADTDLISNISETIATARSRNIPVIYVVVGFRKDYPEVSGNNKAFSALKSSGRALDTEEAMQIATAVAPKAGDITVVKRRISAFAGSDLEVVLRARGVQHMILTGIATGGVVLSTLREAADKDYKLTVLSDCCADLDPEIHNVLMTKVFPRQAEVMTHIQWIEAGLK